MLDGKRGFCIWYNIYSKPMKKKLPVRKFTINEKDGSWVTAIAITETPAIESNFITFSVDEKIHFTANDDRKELLGIAMKANQLIYRNSKEFGEYECYFDSDTIRQIAQIYFQKGLANNLNIEHSDVDAEAFVYQSFIIDTAKGINSPKGLNAKDGDWVIGVKCTNDKIFNTLKSTNAGFSVEGVFQMLEEDFSEQQSILEAYFNALNSLK
jgi:Putative phage serine protease XkdF